MAGPTGSTRKCAADTYGRLLGVLQKLGAGAPEIWRKKVQEAEAKGRLWMTHYGNAEVA